MLYCSKFRRWNKGGILGGNFYPPYDEVSFSMLAANGLQLGEVGEIEIRPPPFWQTPSYALVPLLVLSISVL